MLQIQCTQKLLKRLDLSPQELPEEPYDTVLGTWYANLVTFGHVDFVLFVNDPTLFTILAHLPKGIFQLDLAKLLKEKLLVALIDEGISEETARQVINELEPAILTKTTSRHMLGSMNDLVNNMLVHMELDPERFGRIDLRSIQRSLNRIPQRRIGWKYAVEAMRESLQAE